MSVPLDRLYTHLNNLCNHDIVISRWLPHGSKKSSDLKPIHHWPKSILPIDQLGVICHDQEPLDFDFYKYQDFIDGMQVNFAKLDKSLTDDLEFKRWIESLHLRSLICSPLNRYDQTILVHSELSSVELSRYQQHDFIPVYWWAHGVISQDWFRYAKHDLNLCNWPNKFHKTFLIYCRAWTGSRQYRLQFLQDIKTQNLNQYCQVNFSSWNDNQHFFSLAKAFDLDHNLDEYFNCNTAPSSASADYSNTDYQHCAIELVLETIYESSRIHLTEKTCRPLACGKPFILAAGPNSLKTLRNYGFKTFAPWINESYDLELDCDLRRNLIIAEMRRLSQMPAESPIWGELHKIAVENKQRFFSEEFTNQLFDEFSTNINQAVSQLTATKKYLGMANKCFIENGKDKEIYKTVKTVIDLYQ